MWKKIWKKKRKPDLPGRHAGPLPPRPRRGASPPRRSSVSMEPATAPLAALLGVRRKKKKEKRSKTSWKKRLPLRDPVPVRGGDLPPTKESSSSVLRCAARAQAPWIRIETEGEKEKREKGKGNGEIARESAGQEGEEINQVGVGSTTWVGSTGSSRGCGRS